VAVYVFDLDGTLCTNTDGDYEKAEPFPQRIDIVNQLYREGHTIKIFTARGMGRSNDDYFQATSKFMDLTLSQLSVWGVKYHQLFMGKVSGDYYIDDKGWNVDDWFRQPSE
jgi:histidinol phosphatase-like enzyme